MVFLSITNCPSSLRGDLSKWLNEINTGVYLGKLSTRVREELWDRICDNIHDGQATMVYSAANAQGFEIKVHNTTWKPTDYEGITLMKRPLKQEQLPQNDLKPGFSNASHYERAKHKYASNYKDTYIVLDLETTGLDSESDRIIEIGALKVVNHSIEDSYQCLVRQDRKIPDVVINLTGITDDMVSKDSICETEALRNLQEFIDSHLVIGYNVKFDVEFVLRACERLGIENRIQKTKDILTIARRKIDYIENYKMETVEKYFGIKSDIHHRALEDCKAANNIYCKLNEI